MNKIPGSSKESETFLRSLLPERPEITLRPMFGNLTAFLNGNMSVGLFGNGLIFRLPEKEGAELLKVKGASAFEPMKGRVMTGYFVAPKSWNGDAAKARPWVEKALEWTAKLPAKKKASRR